MELRFIYFDIPFWRAEMSRLALHIGGVPFQDVRPSREEFQEMKSSGALPYGQLPVLEVDGVMVAQSLAIARFCGRSSGLYPENPLDAARVDEILDTANQIMADLAPGMREKDPETRASVREHLGTVVLPKWFGLLEQRLLANGDTGYFVGEQITVADLAIWRLVGWLTGGILDGIPTTLLEPHPALQRQFDTVDQRDDVRAWMTKCYGKSQGSARRLQ
jgi:prostaglandin-H2 D-isomerase / glutathione transferase